MNQNDLNEIAGRLQKVEQKRAADNPLSASPAVEEDLPCPFCGSTDLASNFWTLQDEEVEALECNNCYAGAPKNAWNKRK